MNEWKIHTAIVTHIWETKLIIITSGEEFAERNNFIEYFITSILTTVAPWNNIKNACMTVRPNSTQNVVHTDI